MTSDLLTRLGSELGEDLRTAVGPPPPMANLRRRHRQRVAARSFMAVLAFLVVVLALPNLFTGPGVTIDPIAPSPTAEPSTPTDPPRTPTDLGAPVVTPIEFPGGPVSLRLLAVRFNNPSLAVIDLQAEEVRVHAPGRHGLPTQDAISGAQVLSDGSVVVWQQDTVTVLPPDLGVPRLIHRPQEMAYSPHSAPALLVVPTVDEKALWVAQIGKGYGEDAVDGRVEIVDIATGEIDVATEVPPDSFPFAAIDGGLVLTTTGGWVNTGDGWLDDPEARATLLVRDDGSVSTISQGWAIAANQTVVAIQSCEQATGCSGELELVDLATGARIQVDRPVEGDWTAVNTPEVPVGPAPWSAAAPDGRLLAGVRQRGAAIHQYDITVVSIDVNTATATPVERFDDKFTPARWDQQGHHVVIAIGRNLVLIDVEAGTSVTLENVIPEGHWVIAMR